MAVFLFFRVSRQQRIAVLVTLPIMSLVLLAILPAQNRVRLTAMFSSNFSAADQGIAHEAEESMASRTYLFKKSVQYTVEHPLLGVGPGQFSIFEGQSSRSVGLHGNWHETHNAYTQISSECGVPALLLMLAGLFGAFFTVNKIFRQAKALGNKEVAHACLCYMTVFVGYMTSSTFLSNGYRFVLPTMISLAIAMHIAAQKEFRTAGGSPLIQSVLLTRTGIRRN
jgi:O-antigen ligase